MFKQDKSVTLFIEREDTHSWSLIVDANQSAFSKIFSELVHYLNDKVLLLFRVDILHTELNDARTLPAGCRQNGSKIQVMSQNNVRI